MFTITHQKEELSIHKILRKKDNLTRKVGLWYFKNRRMKIRLQAVVLISLFLAVLTFSVVTSVSAH